MGFVDMPPVKYKGVNYDYALVVVCRLSGYIFVIPCKKKGLKSEKVAICYFTESYG